MALPSAFRLLSNLSTIQRKKIKAYLESAFFYNRKELLPVLRTLLSKKKVAPQRDELFAAAYPDKAYNKRDWYLLVSRMQDATEAFLSLRIFQSDEFLQKLSLLRAFRRLQNPDFFQRSFKQARKLRKKRRRHESAMLLWDYQVELEYYDYIASPKRKERTNLQKVSDKIDHFFIAEKLRQACLANSRFIANGETYEIRYLDAILEDLEARPELFKVPAIVVYACCYQAVVAGRTEADFQRLRQVIDLYHSGFPNSEIRDIYLLAINFCIRAMNEGKEEFVAQTRALYLESLAGGYLLEDGQLPESTFTNMVALGLKMKDFTGVSDFVGQYAKDLPPANRDSLVNFNLARLHHAQGRYNEALKMLVRVETNASYLYLGAKSLQLRIFYEHQEWEALDGLLDQLRVYLQRRSDLGYQGESYRLFLKHLRQFIQLEPSDKKKKILLRRKILSSDSFAEKEWLLDQLGK